MMTPQVATAPVEAAVRVVEAPIIEEELAKETARGPWAAVRRRFQTIFSNYMYQQGMLGLYGDGGDFDDP